MKWVQLLAPRTWGTEKLTNLPENSQYKESKLREQVESPKSCILNQYTLRTPTLSVILTAKPQFGIIILILQEAGDWNCGNFSEPNPVSGEAN